MSTTVRSGARVRCTTVLKRGRKTPGYTLSHWSDAKRTRRLHEEHILERRDALNAMSRAIALGEQI